MDVLQSMQRKEVFKMNTVAQKNCPYCHSDDPDDNRSIFERDDEYLAIGGTGDVEIDEGNGFIPEENFYFYEENLFKFCPMCGRPLNEEEE